MSNVNQNLKDRYFTAEQLKAMSSADINRYCFIPGSKSDWTNDFNAEVVNNIQNYDLLKTLSGKPLSYVMKKFEYNLFKWIPNGKKLNPKILYTLQSILETNIVEVRNASLTGTANSFISSSCTKLTEIINKAFECSPGLEQ